MDGFPGVKGFTVIDVIRHLRIEPTPGFDWSVGHLVRNRYVERYGALPPKDNRRKTNNPKAVHCFAIYPRDMWDDAVGIVRAQMMAQQADAARQMIFEW